MPRHESEPVLLLHDHEDANVVADQPVVRPPLAEPGQLVPPKPGKLAGRVRILGQPLEDRQVVLGDQPQRQVIVHGWNDSPRALAGPGKDGPRGTWLISRAELAGPRCPSGIRCCRTATPRARRPTPRQTARQS